MRRAIIICLMSVYFINMTTVKGQNDLEKMKKIAEKIEWNSQASIKIRSGNKVIYIDPYRLDEFEKADMIFITHDHGDHLSANDIKKIAGPETRFIVSNVCEAKLKSAGYSNIKTVNPGDKLKIDNISVEAVPAYNVGKSFHPKKQNHVGFVLTLEGVRIYHAGDTNRIPEMKNFSCDIALVPLGQTYTMNNVEEAVEAIKDVKAKIAIPFHYGGAEGSKEDAVIFRDLLKAVAEVMIKN